MRKIQSSAQLMEKSRNPGVGYWSAAPNGASTSSSSSTVGTPLNGPRSGDITPSSEKDRPSLDGTLSSGPTSASMATNGGSKGNEEEEVNLEVSSNALSLLILQYLRNVILQFLENPLMRRQLVQVLAVILHFTPQELRRLNAKITA